MPRPRRSRFSALDAGRFRIEVPDPPPADDEPADPGALPLSADEEQTPPAITVLPPTPEDAPAFATKERIKSRAAARADRVRWFWAAFLALACLTLGAAGDRFLGAPASAPPKPATASKETVKPLTQTEQAEVDAAYEAGHAEHYAEARERFAELERRHPEWGMMEIEVGRTQYYEEKLLESRVTLAAAIDRGIATVDAHFLLAMVYFRGQHFVEAESYFAQAIALDPSRADIQFFWGECLQREGKPLEAAGHFRSALLCNQYETAESFYRLKWWLCLIESDQENSTALNAQIDAALALPFPPMEAFFAAAARDLKAGKFGAAAGHLLRGRRRTDPKVFLVILADPLFAPLSARPEFAELFRPFTPPPARPEASRAAGSPEPSPSPAGPPAKP